MAEIESPGQWMASLQKEGVSPERIELMRDARYQLTRVEFYIEAESIQVEYAECGSHRILVKVLASHESTEKALESIAKGKRDVKERFYSE